MILYKYVDAKTLGRILKDNRIGFSHPRDFNDPFDKPRVSRQPYDAEYYSLIDGRLMTRETQAAEADAAWNDCAVSSFTRTFDNALMWAHYANKHTGAVIEIDADRAGLMSRGLLIPVQFGSVIYMKRPNPDPAPAHGRSAIREGIIQRGDDRFDIENYAGLQRLFLTKPLAWAYEEEVRAVCEAFQYGWDDDGLSLGGLWSRYTKSDDSVGYGLRIPPRSITKVFAGLRYKDVHALRDQAREYRCELMLPVDQSSSGYEVYFESDGSSGS